MGEIYLLVAFLVFMLLVLKRMKVRRGFPWILYLLLIYAIAILLYNLPIYKANAIRDSVIILYALYALLIFNFLYYQSIDSKDWLRKILRYLKYLPLYYVSLIFLSMLGLSLSFVNVKAGDMGVHMGFVSVAFFLRLVDFRKNALIRNVYLISIVCVFTYLAAYNRGGALSLVSALFLMFLLKRKWNYFRYMFVFAVIMVAFLALLSQTNYVAKKNFQGRSFSLATITTNFQSIINTIRDVDISNLREGSAQGEDVASGNIIWRLMWWVTIIDYTFFGDYFWMGKGFGVSLGADYHRITEEVRSPHNGHLTILARMGVIGFSFWLLFLSGFLVKVLYCVRTLRMHDLLKQRDFLILTFSSWIAFLVNASFDVFLEGPMGGIPFWTLTGVMFIQFSEVKNVLKKIDN